MTCNPSFANDDNFKKKIVDLLKSKLFIDTNNEIDEYYNPNKSITAQPPLVQPVLISNSFSLRQPFDSFQTCPIIGHDIPLWFDKAEDFKKTDSDTEELDESSRNILENKEFNTVMLVSQDPLRRDNMGGFIQLSSPWGLHGADYKGAPTNLIRFIIDELLKAGKNVYITDYSKLYVEDVNTQKKSVNTQKKSIDLFTSNDCIHGGMFDILQEEWKLLNQGDNNTIVILLGKSNRQIIKDLQDIIKPSSLIIWNHPASCRYGKANIDYYKNELKKL